MHMFVSVPLQMGRAGASDPGDYSALVEAGRQAIARTLRHAGVCNDLLSMVGGWEGHGLGRMRLL